MLAPEGNIILYPLLIIVLAFTAAMAYFRLPAVNYLAYVAWILLFFCLQFFRDPQRILPDDPAVFVSPADGRIVVIQPIEHDDHIQGPALQISIFLSVFNVHSQKVPFDAVVDTVAYNEGKFLAAFNDKASMDNEHAIVHFTSDRGKFSVKQIAGIIARRIINYMEPGANVERGQRLGFIRFGSRVDLIVPANFDVRVQLGDKVKGNRTTIGYFGS